jgi:hypothetical protein
MLIEEKDDHWTHANREPEIPLRRSWEAIGG